MDKEYFDVLVFGHLKSKTWRLRIYNKTFKIAVYLLIFGLLSTILFFCDYIQVKKKSFELNKLHQETQVQNAQIRFFLARIGDFEQQLSKLKDFDTKIRIIANLEKGEEVTPLKGMGGPSPSDIRDKLTVEKEDKGLVQQMRSDIERLQVEAVSREESLSELEKLLQAEKMMLVHTPSIRPVTGWVTSGFGLRTNPFTGLTQMHEGFDVANHVGAIVIAPADGTVSDIADDIGLGRTLVISHGFGIITRYGHLDKALVRIGQNVKRGDKIAEVGMSGKTTGPHLHYEVRINGIPVNPMRYILD